MRKNKNTESLLDEIANKIVEHFHPDQIILFGSYAYGEPKTDSDLDLLVIMDTDLRPTARSAAVARICRPKYVAMDIVVRTPEEIQTHLQNFDPISRGNFQTWTHPLQIRRVIYKRDLQTNCTQPLKPNPLRTVCTIRLRTL